jgi:hypothetical protein
MKITDEEAAEVVRLSTHHDHMNPDGTEQQPAPWTWDQHQAWEATWWDSCTNTFAEEAKQISYAHRMGLIVVPDPTGNERWPVYSADGKSILDIGGGPVSLLLKVVHASRRVVADPCDYPPWVYDRYYEAGIEPYVMKGETLTEPEQFSEVWIYNCLQHVDHPEVIIDNAKRLAPVIRVFEWLNVPPCNGHPHTLTAELLDAWYGGRGIVEQMTGENACYGTAYYGVFEPK